MYSCGQSSNQSKRRTNKCMLINESIDRRTALSCLPDPFSAFFVFCFFCLMNENCRIYYRIKKSRMFQGFLLKFQEMRSWPTHLRKYSLYCPRPVSWLFSRRICCASHRNETRRPWRVHRKARRSKTTTQTHRMTTEFIQTSSTTYAYALPPPTPQEFCSEAYEHESYPIHSTFSLWFVGINFLCFFSVFFQDSDVSFPGGAEEISAGKADRLLHILRSAATSLFFNSEQGMFVCVGNFKEALEFCRETYTKRQIADNIESQGRFRGPDRAVDRRIAWTWKVRLPKYFKYKHASFTCHSLYKYGKNSSFFSLDYWFHLYGNESIDWLIDWLIVKGLIDWLMEWLIDWLFDCEVIDWL